MMYTVGRLLQFAGLVVLPLAIAMELQNAVTLRSSLMLSGLGVIVFALGHLIQGRGTADRQ